MYLTKEEEKMLDGEFGEIIAWAMDSLVKMGDIFNAKKMIPIKSAHCSCTAYSVDGKDAVLEFMRDIAKSNLKVKVPSTSQVISIDLERWKEMNVKEELAKKQIELKEYHESIGISPTWTCSPYLVGNVPNKGDNVAWCESSAIIYANSILGARTNRECCQSALFSALTGRVAEYGYHLKDNRKGQLLVKVDIRLKELNDFGALGYYVGEIAGLKVPVFEGFQNNLSVEQLKALGSTLATTGGISLFHIVGLTPEASTFSEAFQGDKPEDVIHVGKEEINKVYEKINSTQRENIDFVYIGCPHATINELRDLSALLEGKLINKNVKLWITTPRKIKKIAEREGIVSKIEKAGGLIVCDTCPVVSLELGFKPQVMVTNSVKQAHYARGVLNLEAIVCDLRKCVEVAMKGRF
jgi:predicted aconitase